MSTDGDALTQRMTNSMNHTSTAAASRVKPPRVKPVRITIDLSPNLHKQLKIWCAQHDASIADVQRGLSERLLEDSDLAAWLEQHLNQ